MNRNSNAVGGTHYNSKSDVYRRDELATLLQNHLKLLKEHGDERIYQDIESGGR